MTGWNDCAGSSWRSPPETVCAEVMGEMVGSEPARDDIALLIIRHRPD